MARQPGHLLSKTLSNYQFQVSNFNAWLTTERQMTIESFWNSTSATRGQLLSEFQGEHSAVFLVPALNNARAADLAPATSGSTPSNPEPARSCEEALARLAGRSPKLRKAVEDFNANWLMVKKMTFEQFSRLPHADRIEMVDQYGLTTDAASLRSSLHHVGLSVRVGRGNSDSRIGGHSAS
jgi:hypothetical protein